MTVGTKILTVIVVIFAVFLSPGSGLQASNSSESYLDFAQSRTVLVVKDCEDKSKSGYGSGVIYQGNKVVTAAHVVDDREGCDIIIKRGTEDTYPSTVIKEDADTDLAILIVAHDYGVGVTFAPSVLGEAIVAVGYPAQLIDRNRPYLSVLFGNISTKDIKGLKRRVDRISAPIYFGSSGGPVFNSVGQVVGIVSSGHLSTPGYNYTVRGQNCINFLKGI